MNYRNFLVIFDFIGMTALWVLFLVVCGSSLVIRIGLANLISGGKRLVLVMMTEV
jgi:hypothetical protein